MDELGVVVGDGKGGCRPALASRGAGAGVMRQYLLSSSSLMGGDDPGLTVEQHSAIERYFAFGSETPRRRGSRRTSPWA